MYNLVDLTDKRIVVVGASRGIGRGTAVLLSKLGAKLILLARGEAELKKTFTMLEGEGHCLYTADVAELSTVEDHVKEIIADNGCVDGLVYCAGVTENRPLQQFKPDIVQRVMDINFCGFIEIVRCFSKKKRFNPGMRIVVISSTAAYIGTKAMTIYAASKAGINGAVRCLAKELSEKEICINAVIPAFIRTEMFAEAINDVGEARMLSNLSRQYLGLGEVEDVASAIAFLLSPAARFITGICMPVDGGCLSN